MVLLPIKIKSIMEICLDNYQCYLNEYLKNEIIFSNVNNYLWDEIEALQGAVRPTLAIRIRKIRFKR